MPKDIKNKKTDSDFFFPCNKLFFLSITFNIALKKLERSTKASFFQKLFFGDGMAVVLNQGSAGILKGSRKLEKVQFVFIFSQFW